MNKTVGLLTLDSRIYNYGGLLQEYALLKTIQSMEFDCEIIDYDVASEMNVFSIKRSLFNISIDKIVKKFKALIYHDEISLEAIEFIKKRKLKFDQFRKSNMSFSKRYKYPELNEASNKYKAIVCGSDQIWNPDYCIPSFFLNFGSEEIIRIIYAASLGKESITRRQIRKYEYLSKNIDYISMREKSGILNAKKMGRDDAQLVLDPTMLIEAEEWILLAKSVPNVCEKYIFVYFLQNSLEKQRVIIQYAHELNLRIVTIPYLHGKEEEKISGFSDIEVAAGPQEFLNLILNAEYIITDSFHATVFSLIFKKSFWVFGRELSNYNMNTRIETLLEYFELKERLIQPLELLSKSTELMPTDIKEDFFAEMQKKSKYFLEIALKSV